MKLVSPIVSILSAEWILTKFQQSNGGAVILVRAIFVASWATILLYVLNRIQYEKFDGVKIFGTILAFVYIALYARFAAQWRYLADVYNKIKETEAREKSDKDILAQWKAGFAEDADELHLATKKIFMSILHHWLDEDAVKDEFIKNTPSGGSHFRNLKSRVDDAYLEHEKVLAKQYK